MRGIYEDYIDNISPDIIVSDTNPDTNDDELISQQPSKEWYKKTSSSGKYNALFAMSFCGENSQKKNMQLINATQKFYTKLLGRRYDISGFHVSQVKNNVMPMKEIPEDSFYDGILTWTQMPNPIFVKVACNFTGTPNAFLDFMLIVQRSRHRFTSRLWAPEAMMYRFCEEAELGWRYLSIDGQVASFIDSTIVQIITMNDDADNYRKGLISQIGCKLYGMGIWKGKKLRELIYDVENWADKRRRNALNEDFISIDDIQMEEMMEDEPNFFHQTLYNTAIIIRQNNANGDYTQKILSLASKLDSSLKMLLDGKCSVNVCVFSDIMRDIMRNDVHLLTDEEMSVMYWQKDREKKKNLRSTDTFVWFDFPKSYSKFIMICKVVDELIEKAYGAFKEPSDIRMGCMNGDETFVHMTFPIGIFSEMYDCSDEEKLEELKGNESGTYMFFYKKTFGNITIEEIWDKERQYMRERIKKNEQN